MKRPRTLVREIELNQTRIAELREDHARIGREISQLVAASKAKVAELVGAEVERLNLSQLPIHYLLSSLAKLGEGGAGADHALTNPLPQAEPGIQAFVKFSRNCSVANRHTLESAGLHWNGRDAGWTGNVTPAQLASLREVFEGRVETSEREAGEDPAMPPANAPGAVSADIETIVTAVEEERTQVDAVTEEQSASTATMSLRSSFAFPRRLT